MANFGANWGASILDESSGLQKKVRAASWVRVGSERAFRAQFDRWSVVGFPVARSLQAGVPAADQEVASATEASMATRPSEKIT